ncbi:MAG: SDR family NAD(P)-dependent oxidoreductase [Myxococcota bacterium]
MAKILMIGATSAIAAKMAERYAQRDDHLYLIARSEPKLTALRQRLGAAVVGFEIGDLTEIEAAEERVHRALDSLGGLDVAVFAHGWLGDQAATERTYRDAESVLQTNLDSAIAMIIPVANYLEAQGRGAIAVMSSVAADRGRPRNYTYAAAKGALNVYLQGLRSRLYRAGVGVHTIRLGPADTPMTADHPKNFLFADPDRVARDIIRVIERGVSEAYVPWYWGPIMGVVRNLPEPVFQRFKFLAGR